jgi:hypothetical protein
MNKYGKNMNKAKISRTTILLYQDDLEAIRSIEKITGMTGASNAIRYSLRETARRLIRLKPIDLMDPLQIVKTKTRTSKKGK